MTHQESYMVKHASGAYKVTPKTALLVRVETNHAKVNGVEVRGHALLADEGRGFDSRYHFTLIMRYENDQIPPSKTVRRTACIMTQIGRAFVAQNPEVMHRAAMAGWQEEITSLDFAIKRHHDDIAKLDLALKKHRDEVTRLDAERAEIAALRLSMRDRSYEQAHAAALAKDQERARKRYNQGS